MVKKETFQVNLKDILALMKSLKKLNLEMMIKRNSA
jgi:hypothetical protein